ncbi:ATP-dependent DNA helicase [Atractiella rhizophila]|nr:ATP-dependent DNA helicase [Atractiella rhizophila]
MEREALANAAVPGRLRPAPVERYVWTDQVFNILRSRFKLESFRTNQLEAINSTLSGEHTFVLMPTGGGKSLLYQLPALVSKGKTKGVTIVVSPLVSLIQDQVRSLVDKDIPAIAISASSKESEKKFVWEDLRRPEPITKLIYVTPEMIAKSDNFRDQISSLHKRKLFARLVIDESHCVSQWGHDFRPDYKSLGTWAKQFPGVPILALTATANSRVQVDIVNVLGIKGCKVFKQSFNRPNISYEVKARPKDWNTEVSRYIKERHKNECGIIYCFSKKTCEETAMKLNELGLNCSHYHAGMSAKDRMDAQQKWQEEKVKVIVATIAFGMGIDKKNCRFVIHRSMPNSLEGYYQETGRAGRDGKKSECVLYFSNQDFISHIHMITSDRDIPREQKDRKIENLHRMQSYCINTVDCRRTQVLQYFDERFDSSKCRRTCDNCCMDTAQIKEVDVTNHAKALVGIVKEFGGGNVTARQIIDIYRGSKNKAVRY